MVVLIREGNDLYCASCRLPVPVNMRAENLKNELEAAVCKTLMMMNACGNKAAVRVWHNNVTQPLILYSILMDVNSYVPPKHL
jgi:hypothetical protein